MWPAAASARSSRERSSASPTAAACLWDSRWHRKHAGRVPGGSTWWAPSALGWWMGVLFAVGSICFALGSFPPYATAVGVTPDNITFFIGSIFFTTASFLQYSEVASAPSTLATPQRRASARCCTSGTAVSTGGRPASS